MNTQSTFTPKGMGWIPDLPDPRDYSYRKKEIWNLLQQLPLPLEDSFPESFDLSNGDEEVSYFGACKTQGNLNTSVAFAVLDLHHYFERKILGKLHYGSALFLYYLARRIYFGQNAGDSGCDFRTAFKTVSKFGIPAEEYWPYQLDCWDQEPDPFVYRIARRRLELKYFRITRDIARSASYPTRWNLMVAFILAGFPIAFGFPVPASLNSGEEIPFRPEYDEVRGGQAVLAMGYQLNRYGRNQHAIRIRTSWGEQWGDRGQGWLPAAYIRHGLVGNMWTLIGPQAVESEEFSRPMFFG